MSSEGVKRVEKNYIPKKEFWIFGLAAFGEGMIYSAMSSYISDFYLNVMGLAPLFVMLLMLLARVWDAINDPIMGIITDKCDSKWGKYKPYVIYGVVPISILTFLMFFVPKFAVKGSATYSEDGTLAWVGIIYILWGMIYTMSDVPFWSLPNAMTPNAAERGKTISFARTMNGVGSAIPMAIIMLMGFIKIDGQPIPYKTRYLVMAIVSAVLGCVLFATSYFTTKERIKIPRPVRDANYVPPLKLIFKSKPLMLVVLMGILSSGRYMLQTAAIHVSRYTFYLNGMEVAQSQSTIQLVFSIFSAVGMFGAMLATPFLIKKFSYKSLLISTCIGGSLSAGIGFLVGILTNYNLWAFVPFLFISAIPLGVVNVLGYAFIGDCLDYMELKTGRRETGLGSACQSFVNKLGSALATVMIIAMYMIVGLDLNKMSGPEGSIEFINPTTLPNNIRMGMFALVSIIPAISLLLCCIPMFFYKLSGKNKEKMLEDLALARIERGVVIDGAIEENTPENIDNSEENGKEKAPQIEDEKEKIDNENKE